MRWIPAEEVDRLLDWHALADHFDACHRGAPPHLGDTLLADGDQRLLTRSAWLPGTALGVKTVSVFPGNAAQGLPSVQGVVVLFSARTGAMDAVIDGAAVTRWKTAGDSVCAARHLARPDSRRLLVVGAGVIARALARAYQTLFPGLQEIAVWARRPEAAAAMASELEADGLPARPAPDLETAVPGADIITCATMTSTPLVQGAWLSAGTHVDLVGAYTPGMREADDEVMRRGRVFVDSRATTVHDIGELTIPIAAGVMTEGDVQGDLHALAEGRAGRRDAREITVFKNGGGAHLDLMVATLVWRSASGGSL